MHKLKRINNLILLNHNWYQSPRGNQDQKLPLFLESLTNRKFQMIKWPSNQVKVQCPWIRGQLTRLQRNWQKRKKIACFKRIASKSQIRHFFLIKALWWIRQKGGTQWCQSFRGSSRAQEWTPWWSMEEMSWLANLDSIIEILLEALSLTRAMQARFVSTLCCPKMWIYPIRASTLLIKHIRIWKALSNRWYLKNLNIITNTSQPTQTSQSQLSAASQVKSSLILISNQQWEETPLKSNLNWFV